MAYTQKAGRANVESAAINYLTNNTPTDPPASSNLNAALYESSRNVSNGSNASQSSGVLYNPQLTTFRPRGTEVYKSSIHSSDKNLTEFPQGVPASFSKGKGSTPHLSSRFNVNPPRKNPMVTSPEKQMRSDLSVTNGFNVSDYSTTESARQDAALMQSNARNRTSGRTERRDTFYSLPSTASSTSSTSSTKPTTFREANAATFVARPGSLGESNDERTYAQRAKDKEDSMAGSMLSLHPDQVRPAEKAAKRSSKVAGTLEKAFLTGSETAMNSAISAANTMSKADEYFGKSGNEAYQNTKELNQVKNQVTEQHERMIKNYETKSGIATSQQNSSDKLKFIAQDFKKDKAAGKYSLNSNSNSNTPVNSNNLFRNERFATDITSGEKRFKL